VQVVGIGDHRTIGAEMTQVVGNEPVEHRGIERIEQEDQTGTVREQEIACPGFDWRSPPAA
jgi:hypothetical protein